MDSAKIMRGPPPRVLIIAESASEAFGGEASLPVHYFRVLTKRGVECWLVVHARTRRELDCLFPDERGRIFYVEDLLINRFCYFMARFMPPRVHWISFGFISRFETQARARRLARKLVLKNAVTVVHQPVPVSPREPSLIYAMGAPVVMGPMNGGMEFPPAFRRRGGFFTESVLKMAKPLSSLLHLILPGKLRAEVLLVANERSRRALPFSLSDRTIELVENGVDFERFSASQAAGPCGSSTVFCFVGRLVGWKAVDILLEAFELASREADIQLSIVGEGPCRAALESQIHSLGVGSRVSLEGWIPQAKLPSFLSEKTHALILPSLYECGGAVVLEAMALGKPVIATRWGGPVDYLDDTSGILVDPVSRSSFVENLAKAMTRLSKSPELRLSLGASAKRRARLFDWERKVDTILEIYEAAARAVKILP